MIFKMESDVEFEADDLEDAMDKLSEHFQKIKNVEDSDLIIGGGIKVEGIGK